MNWPFDQPLNDLISPETLGSWNTENCALFQPSVNDFDLSDHGVDIPMSSQLSAHASHDLGGGSLEGRHQGLVVQSSDNGAISQGSFTFSLYYLSNSNVFRSPIPADSFSPT